MSNSHTLAFIQDIDADPRKKKYLGIGGAQMSDLLAEATLIDDSDANHVISLLQDISESPEALTFLGLQENRVTDMLSEFNITTEQAGGAQEELTVAVQHQTDFTLNAIPADNSKVMLFVNGNKANQPADFIINGTQLTWLNRDFKLSTDDVIEIYI